MTIFILKEWNSKLGHTWLMIANVCLHVRMHWLLILTVLPQDAPSAASAWPLTVTGSEWGSEWGDGTHHSTALEIYILPVKHHSFLDKSAMCKTKPHSKHLT